MIFGALLLCFCAAQAVDDVYMCDENNARDNWFIYCEGPLLAAAQYHEQALNFNDSKYFVDMPMTRSANETITAFNVTFGNQNPEDIDVDKLAAFLKTYFKEPGQELVSCIPSDWQQNPKHFDLIKDPQLKQFALELNLIWKDLCRTIKKDVSTDSSRYSLLYVPNPFIIPGGRFREFYYWDAYWIIKGLIVSGMTNTTKDMIQNLVYMVETYGFVPNGGRVYYLRRSQPPLLTGMVYEYYQATGDLDFVRSIISTLQKELSFWDNNRKTILMLNNVSHSLYQYRPVSNTPRPEGYYHDVTAAGNLTGEARRVYFQNLAATAESGWDFSTRWFNDSFTMDTVKTTQIVPVDLNSYIYWNLRMLQFFFAELNVPDSAAEYGKKADQLKASIRAVFYDSNSGSYFDFHLDSQQLNTKYYASTITPIFVEAYDTLNQNHVEQVVDYLNTQGVLAFQEGVPTSTIRSNQQWDMPNGWANLQHLIIEAFRKSSNARAQNIAFLIAEKWVIGNYETWQTTKAMFEKYDVTGLNAGHGGLYDVQIGFGWSNGVVLDLLVKYGDRLSVPVETATKAAVRLFGLLFVTVLIVLI